MKSVTTINNTSFNFDSIEIGSIYSISYFIILLNKKRKIFRFTGICSLKNKKSKTFKLFSLINGEKISILFNYHSPSLISVQKISKYTYKIKSFKLNKISNILFKFSSLDYEDRLDMELFSFDKFKDNNIFNIFKFLVSRGGNLKDLKYQNNNKKVRYIKSKFRL